MSDCSSGTFILHASKQLNYDLPSEKNHIELLSGGWKEKEMKRLLVERANGRGKPVCVCTE